MKKNKKILIAVCAVVLAAAVIVGVVYAVSLRKVPKLQRDKLRINPINYNTVFIVGQPPYTDRWVFDTPLGMDAYWTENHNGGNGIEIVLQQTKDGELIVLSEALPALSNADDLYGRDVRVSDLTLEQLRRVNFCYDFTDEDGFQSYVGVTDEELPMVSVVTFDEMLDYFDAPNRITIRLFLRFFDESLISRPESALQAVYTGLEAHSLTEKAVFLPQGDAFAKTADSACPELMRAATAAEAKALLRDCLIGKTPDSLPYSTIYEKAEGQFGSEKFIHYVRNLGMAIVLSDVDADDVAQYRLFGVTAIAAKDAPTFIALLQDAKQAEREAKTAAD